jgi:bile acid:Na+ symporter, BASS family
MNITSIILLVLKTSIMLSVFAIGLKATFADVTFLFRNPGHLFRALLSMNVLMPLIALALAATFDLHPAVKIALVAISVSPIPPVLPNKALKAGGKEDYTIGLLVAMAILSIIFIPIAIEIVDRIVEKPLAMRAGSIALLVLTTILVPLGLGLVVRAIAPRIADRFAKPISRIASLMLLLSFIPVLIVMARPMLSLVGDGTLLTLAAFAVAGLIIGHLLGGPEPENRSTLAFATSSRHPAIAIAIASANYPEQKFAVPAVILYVILCSILSALYTKWVHHEGPGGAPATAANKKPVAA